MTAPVAKAPLSVYMLDAEWLVLRDAMMDAGGEITPEIQAQMDRLGVHEAENADHYAALVKDLDAHAKAVRQAIAELQKKALAAEHSIESIKQRTLGYMLAQNIKTMPGRIWTWARQRNGGTLKLEVLVAAESLPEEFQRKTITVNYDAINRRLEDVKLARKQACVVMAKTDPQSAEELENAALELLTEDGMTVLARQEPRGQHVRIR